MISILPGLFAAGVGGRRRSTIHQGSSGEKWEYVNTNTVLLGFGH